MAGFSTTGKAALILLERTFNAAQCVSIAVLIPVVAYFKYSNLELAPTRERKTEECRQKSEPQKILDKRAPTKERTTKVRTTKERRHKNADVVGRCSNQ